MIYPQNIEAKIGFDHVARRVGELCVSAPGRRRCAAMLKFSTDYSFVLDEIAKVGEMQTIIASGDPFSLGSLSDMLQALHAVKAEGSFLVEEDVVRLRTNLQCVGSITQFFEKSMVDSVSPYPLLASLAEELNSFPLIVKAIDALIDRFGQVKDNASAELAEIRRSLSRTQASLGSVMRRVMTSAIENGYLEADTSPVVRSGRLVLPVSPMNKRKIPGIVHDESATGKTFYIEPAELVETNNRIRELQIEERREVTRLLRVLTSEIRPEIDEILLSIDAAGVFDFIRAKAMYAAETGGCRPHISKIPDIEWWHAVNPVLEATLSKHNKHTVPLDIRLSQKERILIISGPNAGGKSVCLKTVGLLQYMLQCGLLPPVYENSHFGIFNNIFIDIGDDQSIEDDLSTYSSHLRNMNFFVRHASDSTLVLIDEFGTGTEPAIGGAIAQAILNRLNDLAVWGVITTHYQNLKTFAEETPGLVNGSMLYDRQKMQPMFRLSIGNAGSSFAIEIARKTGLPSEIIDEAAEIVGSDYVNMDKFLLDIARDRRYWENKRHDIRQKEKRVDEMLEKFETDTDSLRTQRREIIAEARRQAEQIIAESNAAVERTIREIRESQADKERTRLARQRLAEQRLLMTEDASESSDDTLHPLLKTRTKKSRKATQKTSAAISIKEARPIVVGANVKMAGQTAVGTVAAIEGKNAVVNFGGIKMKVSLEKLSVTDAKPKSASQGVSFISAQTADASRQRQLNFSQEIDLRGVRLDEALRQVTYYIDDAVQFNASRVRILHGTGTGALRQGIRELLRTHDAVESYSDELPQFGGAGVTIVNLR